MHDRWLLKAALLLPALFLSATANAQVTGNQPFTSPASLASLDDDATLLDPGLLSFDLYSSYSRFSSGYGVSAPGIDMAVGLNPRLELSAFSGFLYSRDDEGRNYELDDTYVGMKVRLLNQSQHQPAVAVKPALELLSRGSVDPLLSAHRVNFVLPLLIQKDFDSWSVSYTGGYMTRGVAFSALRLEGNWWGHFTPMALVSYSQATTQLDALTSLGLNRRQIDGSFGVSEDINSRWSIFVQAGRTIGRLDSNNPSFECTVGITFSAQWWGRPNGTSPTRFPIHF